MNPEAQERLDEILKISPQDLTPEQKAFLRARRTYLKESQEEEYAEVLNEKEEVVEVEENQLPENGLTYPQLLAKAKELGYTGGRIKRPELEKFVLEAEEEKKRQNPFN